MSGEKSERELLAEISGKLDLVIGALAIQGRDPASQINVLESLGMDSSAIGALLGLSASSVRGRKFRRKKSK
jgi:hypothetical protein